MLEFDRDINTFIFLNASYNTNKGGETMNQFNPFIGNINAFPTTVTSLPPVVTNLPPIVTRHVNIIQRTNIINQPHIHEEITQVQNHTIKRHQCCTQPSCHECCSFVEEPCCPCPPMPCGANFLGGPSFINRPWMQGMMQQEPMMQQGPMMQSMDDYNM
jgi:hypothetical protein